MVTCAKCGTQFDGRFCPSCGTPAPDPAPGFVPPPAAAPVVQGIPTNIASVLAYLIIILGPIFCLVVAPTNQDKKVRFDAFQALFIQIAFIVVHMVLGVFPYFMWHVTSLLRGLVDLAYFVIIVYMIAKSAQNQKVVLPYVGPLAEKQA
jgi:uncharacterized membrane protein